MKLSKEQFVVYRYHGLNTKDIKMSNGEHEYYICVSPTIDHKVINEPNNAYEDKFLRRDDIDIKFDIHSVVVGDYVYTKLMFDVNKDIIRRES